MQTTTKTFRQAVDEAIDTMPSLARSVYSARMLSRRYRKRVLPELQLALARDERAAVFGFSPGMSVLEEDSKFTFDPDQWKAFFELIIEYLPAILDIIFKYFFMLLLLLALPTSTANAQSDFPDITGLSVKVDDHTEQLEKLTKMVSTLSSRLDMLEKQLQPTETLPPPAKQGVNRPVDTQLRSSNSAPQATTVTVSNSCPPGTVCPLPTITYTPNKSTTVHSTVSPNYKPRWKNYDGLGFYEHAQVMHGINTAGMSYAEVAYARDHDHDMYGGGHSFARTRTVSGPLRSVSSSTYQTCPAGGCPTTSSGWFPGKLLKRALGR